MADDPTQGGGDPTQAFQNRLNKMNGDAMAFATQLFDENHSLRADKRTLNEQLEAAKAKIPAEGAKVLTPAEAADYDAYVALGKPKEIQDRIDAHSTLETENAALKKKDVLREVADLHGYKLSVLEDRDKAAGGLEFTFKEDKDRRKVAHVKDGDKETPVTEYAESNWADYLPSLKVEEATPAKPGARRDPKAVGAPGNGEADKAAKAQMASGYRNRW